MYSYKLTYKHTVSGGYTESIIDRVQGQVCSYQIPSDWNTLAISHFNFTLVDVTS